jgi:hypothetical protein
MASDTGMLEDEAVEITVSKKEKKPVADKWFIDAAGIKADIEKATGLSYTSLATKTTFVHQLPGAVVGDPLTMLALFGATTLATNTASFNRGSAKAEDRYPDDTDAVKARFEAISKDDWGTRKGGGVGIDVQILFDAITEVMGEEPGEGQPDVWKTKMATPEYGETRKILRNHEDIGEIYDRIIRERRAAALGPQKPLSELLKLKI